LLIRSLKRGVDKTSDKEVEVPINLEDLALRALYLCKRKRAQFEWACGSSTDDMKSVWQQPLRHNKSSIDGF
jgi:hypothetical protein